jgi:hypothetical protein
MMGGLLSAGIVNSLALTRLLQPNDGVLEHTLLDMSMTLKFIMDECMWASRMHVTGISVSPQKQYPTQTPSEAAPQHPNTQCRTSRFFRTLPQSLHQAGHTSLTTATIPLKSLSTPKTANAPPPDLEVREARMSFRQDNKQPSLDG